MNYIHLYTAYTVWSLAIRDGMVTSLQVPAREPALVPLGDAPVIEKGLAKSQPGNNKHGHKEVD